MLSTCGLQKLIYAKKGGKQTSPTQQTGREARQKTLLDNRV